MKRIFSLFLVVLIFYSSVQGCEFKDIDKRFFITAIGIDKGKTANKKYRVSLKIAIPKGQLKMGQEDYITVAMDDNSISQAIQKLKTTSDKEFDFGHAKVLVFGEDLVKKDYRDPLDWCTRQRFVQKIAWVAIGKPSAEELLLSKQKSERLPANALILAFGGQGVESQYIVSQYLYEFYRKSKDPGKTPVLPFAEPVKTEQGSYYKIKNAGVFNQNKLVLTMTPKETKFYNILSGEVEKSDYTIKVRENEFTVHADQVKVQKKFKDNQITVTVSLEGIAEEELKREKIERSTLDEIESATEKEFSKTATTLLEKFRNNKVDPIGFGELYRASNWQDSQTEIENWKKIYPKVQLVVNAKCTLRAPGAIE